MRTMASSHGERRAIQDISLPVTNARDESFLTCFIFALAYGMERGWKGFDPYDALLSPLTMLPMVGKSPHFRLVFTQIVKRMPLNARKLLCIGPTVNPKALALSLSGVSRAPESRQTGTLIAPLASQLEESAVGGWPGVGWGYPFPWQGRSFYLPRCTPTVVVTAFAGEAFLDAHAVTGDARYLSWALDACRFVREALNRTEDETGFCLSYSPLDHTAVYNASLLGARLLVLTGQRARKSDLVEWARPLVTFVLARQRHDGSWPYGEANHQGWTDSFHTGFVLGALDVYRRATGDRLVTRALEKGARYYALQFFGPSGEPYYYSTRRYPFDIHSAAQGVLTFLQLRDLSPEFTERALSIGRWMVGTMLAREGFFYYQVRRTHTVKIPYMRWSQAWGVRALAELARCTATDHENLD